MEIFQKLKAIHPRYALLWELGIYTGLRISDLLKLKAGDIKPILSIKEQKTKAEREIKLDNDVMADIRLLIDTYKLAESEFIFFRSRRNRKNPLSRQWAHAIIASTATRMGLEAIGTHSMRKTYACNLYASTGSLEAVREALGHKRVETTILYLRDLLKKFTDSRE